MKIKNQCIFSHNKPIWDYTNLSCSLHQGLFCSDWLTQSSSSYWAEQQPKCVKQTCLCTVGPLQFIAHDNKMWAQH